MSRIMKPMTPWPGRLLAFAYKTLCLSFLVLSMLRFSVHDGGWFNYSMVFLALSCPLVLVWLLRRRLLRSGEE